MHLMFSAGERSADCSIHNLDSSIMMRFSTVLLKYAMSSLKEKKNTFYMFNTIRHEQ